MDELTFTLHHPLTDEEWDAIVDVDFEYTDEITFHTKNGKKVVFVKKPHWIPCSERLPEKDEWNNAFLVTIQCEHVDGWEDYYVSGAEYSEYGWEYIPCPVGAIKVVAWMIVSISPYRPAPHCTDDYCEIEIEGDSE